MKEIRLEGGKCLKFYWVEPYENKCFTCFRRILLFPVFECFNVNGDWVAEKNENGTQNAEKTVERKKT